MSNSKQKAKLQPQFSTEFLSQLGVPAWSENPEFFHRPVENQVQDNALLETQVRSGEPESQAKVPVASSEPVQNSSNDVSTVQQVARVFIASGVDEIWQNETSLAWQLWESILFAFGWQESEVEFFDAATMVTEESLFDCMEAVMELPIDQVFVMLDDHPIVEMLQEGLEVVHLPSFEEMLDDPYAKQRFYQSVIQYA